MWIALTWAWNKHKHILIDAPKDWVCSTLLLVFSRFSAPQEMAAFLLEGKARRERRRVHGQAADFCDSPRGAGVERHPAGEKEAVVSQSVSQASLCCEQ